MTRNSRFRSLAAALGALAIAAACGGGGGGGTSETLASDQTLSFPVVDDVVLERGRGGEDELEKIVPSLRGDFGLGVVRLLVDVEVVDDHLDAVPLAPAPRVVVVPPPVVPGHVVVPLGDPQRMG